MGTFSSRDRVYRANRFRVRGRALTTQSWLVSELVGRRENWAPLHRFDDGSDDGSDDDG